MDKMTDQDQGHPTAGRRRRHKSPAALPTLHDLPFPRLLDHMGAEDGPSDAEEERERRSASTAPRSTTGALPHDYDMVMGIAPAEPQESVRFEEGDNSEFQDVVETAAHSQEFSDQPDNEESKNSTEAVGAGEFHGGYGGACLRECLERTVPQEPTTSAALHSGAGMWASSSQLTNPPQVMTPNMEQNQSQETTPVKDLPHSDPRKGKEWRKT